MGKENSTDDQVNQNDEARKDKNLKIAIKAGKNVASILVPQYGAVRFTNKANKAYQEFHQDNKNKNAAHKDQQERNTKEEHKLAGNGLNQRVTRSGNPLQVLSKPKELLGATINAANQVKQKISRNNKPS
jgi:hypothetical protein